MRFRWKTMQSYFAQYFEEMTWTLLQWTPVPMAERIFFQDVDENWWCRGSYPNNVSAIGIESPESAYFNDRIRNSLLPISTHCSRISICAGLGLKSRMGIQEALQRVIGRMPQHFTIPGLSVSYRSWGKSKFIFSLSAPFCRVMFWLPYGGEGENL